MIEADAKVLSSGTSALPTIRSSRTTRRSRQCFRRTRRGGFGIGAQSNALNWGSLPSTRTQHARHQQPVKRAGDARWVRRSRRLVQQHRFIFLTDKASPVYALHRKCVNWEAGEVLFDEPLLWFDTEAAVQAGSNASAEQARECVLNEFKIIRRSAS
jgi:hypothetical protein